MDDESIRSILLVAFFALLLIGSGMFSGTETALFSLDRVQRRRLQEERSIRAQLITRVLRRPRQLLSTILFGNTLINVATSAVATLVFEYVLHQHSPAAVIVVDLFLVLLVGEIIPKTIAVNAPLAVSVSAITPLTLFTRLSAPVVNVFDSMARRILRGLRVPEEPEGALGPSELEVLFEEASRRATITPEERRIARNIMRFSETNAAEVMTPRPDLVVTPLDGSRETLTELMTGARHTRIPVYKETVDNIVGFVSTKEYLLNQGEELRELLKPVAIFPEGARLHRVFRHMQKQRLNMSVIVNEYGETAGIITVEDVMEEIVGEIYDEYEKAEELIREVGPREWLVMARSPLDLVNATCGLSLPESESITLNGYLTDQFGEIPGPGRVLEQDGARFTIVESVRRRVVSCRVEGTDREKAAPDG